MHSTVQTSRADSLQDFSVEKSDSWFKLGRRSARYLLVRNKPL
jgi:hypothetical protein